MDKLSISAKQDFRRAAIRKKILSHLPVVPLLLFILVIFVIPIGMLLLRSVYNPEVSQGLPRVASSILDWDGKSLPEENVFRDMIADLQNSKNRIQRASAARRLNYELIGYRTLILKSARKLSRSKEIWENSREALISIDKRWGEITYWHALKRASPTYTNYYLLAALDLKIDDTGSLTVVDSEQQIFVDILLRSLWISIVVTVICLLIAFPVANFMVIASPRMQQLIGLCVLFPFWTSLLVRTSAWIVILQKEGIINRLLTTLNIISNPLDLIFNRFGVYIAMIHILLPFMLLTLYGVMKGISPCFTQAAESLGANSYKAFRFVYLPLTLPGIGAGCLLTFILGVGYYITPALVGGAKDQMIGYFIAFFTNTRLNWGMASALSVIILLCIFMLYAVFGRYIGIHRLAGIKDK